ncbi:MAG TPA: biotin--[acetyl-CoA-carboxylase] ligase [Lachnospiraceae bacterium]|nr:biotin--[acetyl-CoA-carboxylase] ligase [Lachnospiraceae bacterium]
MRTWDDPLDTRALSGELSAERMKSVYCYDCINSTNLKLNELSEEGAGNGTVVIANEQSGGRGRRGRSFLSPRDKGIYLSWLLKRREPPERLMEITAWSAVSVVRAIEAVSGTEPRIKWVNDIVLNKKKICGILAEMFPGSSTGSLNSIIIGIGINVNEEASFFDGELSEIASSIYAESGRLTRRAALAAALIRELDDMSRDFPDNKEKYLGIYRERSIIAGKSIYVSTAGAMEPANRITEGMENCRRAQALGINDDFSLKLKYEDGTVEDVNSGEISIRGMYGYV